MQFVQDEVFRLISSCISLTRHHNWLKKRREGAFISSVYKVLIPSLPWLSYFKCYGNTSKAFLDKELLSKLWKHHLINFYNWLLTTFLDSSLKRKQELPLFWDLQKKKKKKHTSDCLPSNAEACSSGESPFQQDILLTTEFSTHIFSSDLTEKKY